MDIMHVAVQRLELFYETLKDRAWVCSYQVVRYPYIEKCLGRLKR